MANYRVIMAVKVKFEMAAAAILDFAESEFFTAKCNANIKSHNVWDTAIN